METRVEKYKTYRSSLIKEGSDKEINIDNMKTTTIPLKDVMIAEQNSHSEISEFKEAKKRKTVVIVSICLAALVIITGIVILGIFAFGGK